MTGKRYFGRSHIGPEHNCRHQTTTAETGLVCRKGVDLEVFRKAAVSWPCDSHKGRHAVDPRTPKCTSREELTRAEGIMLNNRWAVAYEHTNELGPLCRSFRQRDGVVPMDIPAQPAARIIDPNAALRRSICSGQRFGEQHLCRYPTCAGEQDYCDEWDSAELRRIFVLNTGAAPS